jgi:hypothetical protein
MTWPEAVVYIVMAIISLIMVGLFTTGKWPWER